MGDLGPDELAGDGRGRGWCRRGGGDAGGRGVPPRGRDPEGHEEGDEAGAREARHPPQQQARSFPRGRRGRCRRRARPARRAIGFELAGRAVGFEPLCGSRR